MTTVDAVNYYLCANLLLVIAAALVALIKQPRPPASRLSHRTRLAIANSVFLSAVLLPIVALFLSSEWSTYGMQVWAASSMEGMDALVPSSAVIEATALSGLTVPYTDAVKFWMAAMMVGVILALYSVVRDARVVRRIVTGAQRFRARGRLEILSSDDVTVPFSLWVPFRFYIVVPSSLILNPSQLRVAMRHEAQHHRQADTKLLYIYQSLKAAFFWNPAVHRIEKWLRELQELACDAAVIARGDIGREEYCHFLLQMAQEASPRPRTRLSASMGGDGNPTFLRKRVLAVLQAPSRNDLFWFSGSFVAIAAGVMGIAAIAFSSAVKDRRVSLEVAGQMAEAARRGSSIPISVNHDVLKQLNAFLATPDGREHLLGSLQRMQDYAPRVSGEIASSGLPRELLAVPLIESGYRNLPPSDKPQHAAGIWMFIAHTARNAGLRIDSERDERLDVAVQTQAAMRHFSGLYDQFGDWGLAFLGYNMGSAQVERAILEAGSRDPWEIIATGRASDAQYLSRLMAAILIINDATITDQSMP